MAAMKEFEWAKRELRIQRISFQNLFPEILEAMVKSEKRGDEFWSRALNELYTKETQLAYLCGLDFVMLHKALPGFRVERLNELIVSNITLQMKLKIKLQEMVQIYGEGALKNRPEEARSRHREEDTRKIYGEGALKNRPEEARSRHREEDTRKIYGEGALKNRPEEVGHRHRENTRQEPMSAETTQENQSKKQKVIHRQQIQVPGGSCEILADHSFRCMSVHCDQNLSEATREPVPDAPKEATATELITPPGSDMDMSLPLVHPSGEKDNDVEVVDLSDEENVNHVNDNSYLVLDHLYVKEPVPDVPKEETATKLSTPHGSDMDISLPLVHPPGEKDNDVEVVDLSDEENVNQVPEKVPRVQFAEPLVSPPHLHRSNLAKTGILKKDCNMPAENVSGPSTPRIQKRRGLSVIVPVATPVSSKHRTRSSNISSQEQDAVLLPCKFCPLALPSHQDLRKHTKDVHRLRMCSKCPKVFKGKIGNRNHFITHFKKEVEDYDLPSLQCKLCDLRFGSDFMLTNHISHKHESNKFHSMYKIHIDED